MGTSRNTAKCLRRQPTFSRLDKSPRFFFLGLTLLVMVFVASAVFYINTHVRVVELGYEITQAVSEKQKLTETNKQLSLKIAQLKSPHRLEKMAHDDLGLTRPQSKQILRLSELRQWQANKKLTQGVAAAKVQAKSTEKKIAKKKVLQKALQKEPRQQIVLAQATPSKKNSMTSSGQKIRQVPTALLDPMP